MALFKELSKAPVSQREQETSKYWEKIDLLHRSVETREGKENYIFYDGPPTANGQPGIHHVISRTLKDMTCRYKTMKGYRVKRKAGWDTHGLPVEIEVEKKLGLKNKKEIEAYGVEKFNKQCRESVFTYEKQWREMSERMAFLADMDDPYITLDNNYIETVWWLLDQMNQKGLIYEGAKILPYCPRCGTGLASHEVALGYENIKTVTVTAKFKLKDEDAYFLAWTTTPWTLPSNVALTVHPDVDYVKVSKDGEVYYLAKNLANSVLGDDYEILDTMKGKDLEYVAYEQLLPFLTADKKAFFVTCADYVTTEDGTGIVHSAPAFGEDDYQTGRRYGLPMFNPVDDEGKFTDTPWKSQFVMDADHDIIHYLFDHDLAYKKQKMEHNYPHCWRCHTPLIYYSKPSWYIEVTKLKELFIDNNNKVNWFPDFVGEKRFGNWLENLNDWAISRSRYWGTPFPMWKCESCGKFETIGSRKELVERAVEEITEDIELHRPYVDDVHLTCECGGVMTREPDVIDVWFDSGAMPFAQHHYPFENADRFFEELFPANFINEGIDQTRGWFYSLLAISTLITGKAPYKNVLVNDLILDKEGKKMSKSRGNTLEPIALFDEYGADVVRFYSIYVSPPWVPTRFDVDGLREAESKFFRSFRNVYNFFSMYANIDEVDPSTYEVAIADRPEIDRWLLSKYNSLVAFYSENMDVFEYTKVIRAISDFVIEDLSNWYIRRNRRRFWQEESGIDKLSVYKTTWEVLIGVSKMVAPFTPFIAEEIYYLLCGGESVHLAYTPEVDETLRDGELERKMDLVRQLVTLGRASRETVKIKVRQPLSEIVVDGKYESLIGDLVPLIKEELNVKGVDFESDLSAFMNYQLKPDFKVAGPVLGKKIKDFTGYLKSVDAKTFVADLERGPQTVELGGESVEIDKTFVQVVIDAKEGFDVVMENGVFVILDTVLTDELIQEGFGREFISKVQQLRKSTGFDVSDHITIQYYAEDVVATAIEHYKDDILSETLGVSVERMAETCGVEVDLNDHPVGILVEQVK